MHALVLLFILLIFKNICISPDCGPHELECDNKCISVDTQVCNNVRDCSDGRDESPTFCGPPVNK
ncbi:hypothetical protein Avbf_01208 [Armadillidium vulgare]|nr:hypothetical protein Avbf_01208 [Armadillidium vulgare]